jgi:hypothetical protein
MMERSIIKTFASFFLALMIAYWPLNLWSQEVTSASEEEPETDYVSGTFSAPRIINGHSVEQMLSRQLEFRISHRFGEFSSGAYDLFGLDFSQIHFSLEYGIKDWLEIGLGRSNFEKTADGFVKVSLLRQSTGARNMPLHLSYVGSAEVTGLKWADPAAENHFSSRMTIVHQLLIARKFSKALSLELNPVFVHRNLVGEAIEPNDLYALGIGGRYKITRRIAFNAEYYYVYRKNAKYLDTEYFHPLSLGFDIETSGHVFQIMLTNCRAMREGGFIGKTTGDWLKGDFRLGFNISRTFSL